MKIIADKYIPNVAELFSAHGDVTLLNPEKICSENIRNADVLLVRTITQVDKKLLKNSRVKFIGSASAGKNHIDEEYLKRHNINFCYAPGCNALAVTEYVMSCLAFIGEDIANKKMGVVGLGHVGKSVSDVLSRAGATVLKSDPPLGLNDNLQDCDVITLHCSWTQDGEHPSHHLINRDFLAGLKPGTIIINAARGGVLDESALRDDLIYCLDVWEGEPNIYLKTFAKAKIKTPHIAGYSLAAKYRATQMLYEEFRRHYSPPLKKGVDAFRRRGNFVMQIQKIPGALRLPGLQAQPNLRTNAIEIKLDTNWQQNLLKIYNPLNDQFDPADFKQARRNYVFRKEVIFI